MLKIINDLEPFFEDCYKRIGVREYAKIAKISPPTSSKLLSYYNSEGILTKENYKNYIMFHANIESKEFINLSRTYWGKRLEKVTSFIEKNSVCPTIILFGSLSKGEAKNDSDVDLAIICSKRGLNLKNFEKKIERKIQIFWFDSIKSIESDELKNNILNGHVLSGRISL